MDLLKEIVPQRERPTIIIIIIVDCCCLKGIVHSLSTHQYADGGVGEVSHW